MSVRLLHGDCREVLKTLPSESVHCCVTSPPFYGLRDYGVASQIGLEATPDAFVAEIVAVFREVKRVLRDDGTLWLNLGDSYAGSGEIGRHDANNARSGNAGITYKSLGEAQNGKRQYRKIDAGLKPKDLIGVPWSVAFALRADGWYLRQDIIWSKPNPMPESVRDRCTKAHEYLFLLSKKPKYFYDAEAIKDPNAEPTGNGGWQNAIRNGDPDRYQGRYKPTKIEGAAGGSKMLRGEHVHAGGRNKRSVWEVATAPFSEAHFATFPPTLIDPCILAGCPAKACATCGKPWVREVEREVVWPEKRGGTGTNRDRADGGMACNAERSSKTLGFSPSCSCNAATVPGTVLDPFAGAGTTGLVADRLGRNAILIELNAGYADMSKRRIVDDAPLFAEVVAA
jgi:DNA modification methylase